MFKLVNQCNKPLNRDLFITVAGNVGAGKSTLTKLVAERLGFEAHYEKVDGNPYFIRIKKNGASIYNYTS